MRTLFSASILIAGAQAQAQLPCMAFHDLHGGAGATVRAIATDAEGATYITGAFTDSVTFGDEVIHGADFNVFVAGFDPANELVWCSVLATNMFSTALAIAVDGAGGVLITGDYMDQLSLGACAANHPGGSDIFLAKLNATDGTCQWLTTGGSIGDAHARALTVAADGTLRVVGGFHGYCTFGTTTLTCTGTMSPFIAAYAADGTALWAKQVVDGTGGESEGVCTDVAGNTYMAGSHGSTGNFGNGITLSPGGQFIAKYNAVGEAQWARQGLTTGSYLGVACDSEGGAWVQHNNPTGMAKYTATGDLQWNTFWSGYGATAFGLSDDHAWLSLWYTTQLAIGTDTVSASSNTNKVALVEVDELGAVVGVHAFDNEGLSRETPLALCFDAAGVPVVGGIYRCTTTDQADTILGLPYQVGDAPFFLRACSNTGIAPAPVAMQGIPPFPNPAHEQVQLQYPSAAAGGLLRITDATGRLVQQQRIATSVIDLRVGGWAPGVYMCTATTAEGGWQQRVVVQ